ncbi:signal peptidase I [Ornithinibacillus salinisoli]|uniref:Signal peptidase I n=1 Tax=Ornithinibacillus salinisoli TaxID=1848459 RepID=A0ABW4W1L7_9BACI
MSRNTKESVSVSEVEEELEEEGSGKSKKANQQQGKKSSVMSWVIFGLILLSVFLLFRNIIGFTVIAGNSMNPTLEENDVLLMSGFFYDIERNDVIVYRDENGFDVIKRVIGMPNETIEIRDGIVFVNGIPMDESFVMGTPNDLEVTEVSENTYFLIGDNRQPGASLDSRDSEVGTIAEEQIKGEIVLSVFPLGGIKAE